MINKCEISKPLKQPPHRCSGLVRGHQSVVYTVAFQETGASCTRNRANVAVRTWLTRLSCTQSLVAIRFMVHSSKSWSSSTSRERAGSVLMAFARIRPVSATCAICSGSAQVPGRLSESAGGAAPSIGLLFTGHPAS